MITIKRQLKKVQPDVGDYIFDVDNIIHSPYVREEETAFSLFVRGQNNPFATLRRMGVNDRDYFRNARYVCPFSQNTFFGIFPFAIQTRNSSIYRVGAFSNESYDFAFNLEEQKDFDRINMYIAMSFLGSGYMDGTLPSDGSHEIVDVKIELDNGDFILAKTFEWYNK